MLTFRMLFQVNSEHGTAKTNDAEGTRFATEIGMISMPPIRVVVRRSCYAISRQSHAFLCNSRIIVHVCHVRVKIALSFAPCNFLTVTDAIILELHSNVCDYLYKLSS